MATPSTNEGFFLVMSNSTVSPGRAPQMRAFWPEVRVARAWPPGMSFWMVVWGCILGIIISSGVGIDEGALEDANVDRASYAIDLPIIQNIILRAIVRRRIFA